MAKYISTRNYYEFLLGVLNIVYLIRPKHVACAEGTKNICGGYVDRRLRQTFVVGTLTGDYGKQIHCHLWCWR